MSPVELLRKIVAIPALSGGEGARADFVAAYLRGAGLEVARIGNNLMARVGRAGAGHKAVVLNSHLDTVAAGAGWTIDPHEPPHDDAKIYGLGSNDAGASVVAMIETALHFNRVGGLDYDIVLLLTAEEERSGENGMSLAIGHVEADCAIIGEPTGMRAAVGERGLIVLDGVARGVGGHAARGEGVNALYLALDDIDALRRYRFGRVSPLMGDVRVTVTQIEAGRQHNVVPDECRFVVDVRPTDAYDNERIFNELQSVVAHSALTPRRLTNRCSATPAGHPLLRCVERLGVETYVSPTTSDWMRIGALPAVKMGPGDSARSHTADEYITAAELDAGIEGYIALLECLKI